MRTHNGKRKHGTLQNPDQSGKTGNVNFVPMPFYSNPSITDFNLPEPETKRIKLDGTVISSWDLITKTLETRICSCAELSERINTITGTSSDFNVLKYAIEEEMSYAQGLRFFDKVLPFMVTLCLDLPNVLKDTVQVLPPRKEKIINLSHKQIASLLANAFFCTFPARQDEEAFLPINFNVVYNCDIVDPRMRDMTRQLRNILNYFERLEADGLNEAQNGVVTWWRRGRKRIPFDWVDSSGEDVYASWKNGTQPLRGEETLIDTELTDVAVRIGENQLFCTYPELIITRLFTKKLKFAESLLVTGVRNFSEILKNAPNNSTNEILIEPPEDDMVQVAILENSKLPECSFVGMGGIAFIRLGSLPVYTTSTNELLPISTSANQQLPLSRDLGVKGHLCKKKNCTSSTEDLAQGSEKIALLLSYCDVQSESEVAAPRFNSHYKSVHATLKRALRHFWKPDKQTPKHVRLTLGPANIEFVSASRQIASFLEPPTFDLEKLNENLPREVRALGFKRVIRDFDASSHCNKTTFIYLIPTFAFAPKNMEKLESYRMSRNSQKVLRSLLSCYVGKKNYYNFVPDETHGRSPPFHQSFVRRICSFDFEKPFESNGIEYILLRVKGHGFMEGQVETMIGLCTSILRGATDHEVFEKAFTQNKIQIPSVPQLGLILENTAFDKYNARHGVHCAHEKIHWEALKEEVEEFLNSRIYPFIMKKEETEKSMLNWLRENGPIVKREKPELVQEK